MTLPARFWAKVAAHTDGCWLWTASVNRDGYGKYSVEGGVWRLAHRVAYEALIGPIPDGLVVDHLCSVRNCINPAHLEPVTNRENLRRAARLITHCPAGHPYDEVNTYLTRNRRSGSVSRRCRLCSRERDRRRYPARRASFLAARAMAEAA